MKNTMTSALLILMMIILYTMQSLFCKVYSDNYPGDKKCASVIFNIVSGAIVAVVCLIFCGSDFAISWQTLLLSIANAAALLICNVSLVKASKSGPYSILMVFMLSGGIIVPVIASRLLGDDFSPLKWLVIAIIVASIWMVSRKKESTKLDKKVFFVACVMLFISNGLYGMFFDLQQRITGVEEKDEMITLTYFIMATVSLIYAAIKRKKKIISDFRQTKKSFAFLILCSFVIASAINVMVYVLSLVDVTLLYTFNNAGVLLFSVIASSILFKEKMSLLNILGCVTMGGGLILISLV